MFSQCYLNLPELNSLDARWRLNQIWKQLAAVNIYRKFEFISPSSYTVQEISNRLIYRYELNYE